MKHKFDVRHAIDCPCTGIGGPYEGHGYDVTAAEPTIWLEEVKRDAGRTGRGDPR